MILYLNGIGNGTALTAEYAQSKKKPLLMLNLTKKESVIHVQKWFSEHEFEVLNIAGPREGTSPGIYKKTLDFLDKVLIL